MDRRSVRSPNLEAVCARSVRSMHGKPEEHAHVTIGAVHVRPSFF
jgi:hypothetical protein